ncbi:MAG: hypothetical protein OXH29_00495 [bacterium]|nr:hypothetical protein [bacterium]
MAEVTTTEALWQIIDSAASTGAVAVGSAPDDPTAKLAFIAEATAAAALAGELARREDGTAPRPGEMLAALLYYSDGGADSLPPGQSCMAIWSRRMASVAEALDSLERHANEGES